MKWKPPVPAAFPRFRTGLATVLLIGLAAGVAYAGPFTKVSDAATDLKSLAKAAATVLGGLVTLAAGWRAAWKTYRDKDWIGYGITAVVAASIAVIASKALN